MTIDKEKLKALAEAARDYSGSDLIEHESRYNALACEVDPVTVLTLLAEIERHEAWRTAFLAERDAQMRQRDQLRAENEGLRKQIADLWPLKNVPPQDFRASNKCLACGDYHHGLGNLPCPRCTPVAQSAMAKEKSHD